MSIDLGKVNFSRSFEISKLNRLIRINNFRLMPHQVATSLGLSLEEGMQLLFYIFHLNFADLYLQIYHNEHPHILSETRNIFDGFPDIPYQCPECEEIVEHEDELSYDYLFILKKEVSFTWSHPHAI